MAKKLKIESRKKREKWDILAKNDSFTDGAMLKGPHTEIFGNSRISVDGCLGVAEYRDDYIKLRINKGTLILCGCEFDIVFFENRLITVKGKISSVEFCM